MDNHHEPTNRFRFALLASKRAKQLINGSKKKVEMTAENPLTIAMEEIKQGRVNYENINSLAEVDRLAEAVAVEQAEQESQATLTEDLAEIEDIESISDLEEESEELSEELSDDDSDDDLDED